MPDSAPSQTTWMVHWFRRYCRRYAAKHFHAVRLSKTSAAIPADGQPLIFAMNHPAWWDVIVAFMLSARWPHYRHYGPIEAAMLRKYRFLARLGLFAVEPTPRGAALFLRTAQAIFQEPFGAIWITAQGRFADPRQRPLALRPGIGAVAARLDRGWIIPVALEYPFWTERTPEALIRFGEPLGIESKMASHAWTERIEAALSETMNALAAESIARDPARFEILAAGRVGVGGVYDSWRRVKAWLAGEPAAIAHADSPAEA